VCACNGVEPLYLDPNMVNAGADLIIGWLFGKIDVLYSIALGQPQPKGRSLLPSTDTPPTKQ